MSGGNGSGSTHHTGDPEGLLSIGDVAAATGISPDTIRVWERRYGRPQPTRLASGHRRYTQDQVRWLRRVAEALARGHRPAQVVKASEDELADLLEPEGAEQPDEEVREMLELVRCYERDELQTRLRRAYLKRGPVAFLDECVAPLVTHVGRRWSDGELEVRHEHFVSEVLQDLLRALRLEFEPAEDAPLVLLTTLPGETHGIGLQMAALVCAVHGIRTRALGVETPLEDIARAAREMGARAVAISVSIATGGVETDRALAELRRRLPDDVRVVIGGRGARGVRRGPRGVEYVEGLRGLATWLETLAA